MKFLPLVLKTLWLEIFRELVEVETTIVVETTTLQY